MDAEGAERQEGLFRVESPKHEEQTRERQWPDLHPGKPSQVFRERGERGGRRVGCFGVEDQECCEPEQDPLEEEEVVEELGWEGLARRGGGDGVGDCGGGGAEGG